MKPWTVHELQILLRGKPLDAFVCLQAPGSRLISPLNADNLLILEEYENTVSCNFWSAGDVKTLIERREEKDLHNETVRRETRQKRREGRG